MGSTIPQPAETTTRRYRTLLTVLAELGTVLTCLCAVFYFATGVSNIPGFLNGLGNPATPLTPSAVSDIPVTRDQTSSSVPPGTSTPPLSETRNTATSPASNQTSGAPSPTTNPPTEYLVAPTNTKIPFALPFTDTFSSGLRPEWQVLGGTPTIFGLDKRLGTGGFSALALRIGHGGMKDYVLRFDIQAMGSGSGAAYGFIYFGSKLRYSLSEAVCALQITSDFTEWTTVIGSESGGIEGTIEFRFELRGTSIEVRRNAEVVSYTEFDFDEYRGAIVVQLDTADTSIDNFVIEELASPP